MVTHISNPNNSTEPIVVQLTDHHNIDPEILRDKIKGALDPLLVDPVPTRIIIDNIIITKDEKGSLTVTCEVLLW